ncbi:MAG: PEP-CTERM sorting domain-containing protein [Microcoleus sp.]
MSKNTRNIVAVLAGTALCYGAISTVYTPIAQAAVLTYNFSSDYGKGFVKFSNSGITGIDVEEITISEGKLTTLFDFHADLVNPRSHDLAGTKAVFDRGEFRGLKATDSELIATELVDSPNTVFGEPYRYEKYLGWYFDTDRSISGQWYSILSAGEQGYYYKSTGALIALTDTAVSDADWTAIYTLADTAPEPVPEPMTVAGTALALASFVGLKHRKKMAN